MLIWTSQYILCKGFTILQVQFGKVGFAEEEWWCISLSRVTSNASSLVLLEVETFSTNKFSSSPESWYTCISQ